MTERTPKYIDDVVEALAAGAAGALPGSTPEGADMDADAAAVLSSIADVAADQPPPDDLFDRIEASIDDAPIPGVETIAATSGSWRDQGNGVWCKLMASPPDGKNVYLLRCMPGSCIPSHRHSGWEYALVLEGRYQMSGRTVGPGDAQLSAANSQHPEITSDTGCLILVVA